MRTDHGRRARLSMRAGRLAVGLVVASAGAVLGACDSDDAPTDVASGQDAWDAAPDLSGPEDVDALADGGEGPTWHMVAAGLPGAALSVTSTPEGDLWVVGAAGEDAGPVVLRRRGDAWDALAPGVASDLWWVTHAEGATFLTGADGVVLRHTDGAGFEAWQAEVPEGTVLYGAWAQDANTVWVVGGPAGAVDGPGVVRRLAYGVVTPLPDLPLDASGTATFFKAFGFSDDDVWVIGEEGHALHFDGGAWTLDLLPGAPRLVTVHGSAPDDIVAVGGLGQGQVWRYDGETWFEDSPLGVPILNGVSVAPDGTTAVAGMLGSALAAGPGQPLVALPLPPLEGLKDYHAAHIDSGGRIWLAGGNLLTASTLDEGVVLCFGDASCAAGAPAPGPAAPPVDPPDRELVDDVVEPDGGDSDAAETITDVADPAPGDTGDDGPEAGDDEADVPADGAPSDADADSVGPEDTDPSDAGADTLGPDPTEPFAALAAPDVFAFGTTPAGDAGGAFVPLSDGMTVEIVTGFQGFVHAEIKVRFPPGAGESGVLTGTYGGIVVQDGVEVATFVPSTIPTPPPSEGTTYETNALFIVFDNEAPDSSPYVGDPATPTPAVFCVQAEREYAGESVHEGGCFDVMLHDTVAE